MFNGQYTREEVMKMKLLKCVHEKQTWHNAVAGSVMINCGVIIVMKY